MIPQIEYMAVQEWADTTRLSEGYQNPEAQQTIETLQTLLEGKSTPQDAAQKLVSAYEPLIRENPNDIRIGSIWGIFCEAVKVLGDNEEIDTRLVDLLRALKDSSIVINGRDEAVRHEWGGVYWSDLPMLALMFREYGINIDPDEDMDQSEWLAQAKPFLNATTFAAICLGRDSSVLDMSLHVQVCFMEAFEVPSEPQEPGARAFMYVPPAATWIMLAGKQIHQLCMENYQRNDTVPGREGLLWTGSGFSPERWAFWKKRFSETQKMLELDSRVREHAGKALVEMDRIDGVSGAH